MDCQWQAVLTALHAGKELKGREPMLGMRGMGWFSML